MTTLLTGATHASRARSTSSTVRARSSGSSASKPRSPRTVGASRTASPRPRSRSISNSGPRSVASTSTVTGSAPRTAMRLLAAVDHVVEGLLVDVLVVGHRVGDRPGHLAGVREVLHARDTREGEADDVEARRSSASRTCA